MYVSYVFIMETDRVMIPDNIRVHRPGTEQYGAAGIWCYEDLYLVDFYPDIETCDKTVRKLVSMSGAGRETQMKHFMKMFFPDQSMALIDGTSIFTGNLYPALHKKIIRSMYRTGRCVFCAF